MPTKSKNVFTHLSDMEAELSGFSFDELTSDEATELKEAVQTFKNGLKKKFFDKKSSSSENGNTNDSPKKENVISETMLIANVSHEIRTPLNGIIGFADLLKESELTKNQASHVGAIQSASKSLMQIINELLEYSKLSAGLSHFESIDFDFHKQINDVIYLCKTLIVNKNVELIVEIDNTIPKALLGDPSKLSQVLLNLIGNAIKFVQKGSIQLQIKQVEQNNDEVLLEFGVIDTGIGMSQNSLEHIFDSFKQAELDTYSKYGGTGLGLNIVKQIIESLNGEISVTSDLGMGSTFKFNLPYKKGNDKNIEKEVKNSENKENLVDNMQILVFEDNTLNQRLIEQRLNKWKCNVFITDKVVYGLNVLKNNKIDLVLMDLRMPEMNGYEVTERIRSSKINRVKEVPIIALTADFTIKDKEKCEEYGINDFILKPYSSDELLNKLIQNSASKGTQNIQQLPINKVSDDLDQHNEKTKVNLDNVFIECMEEMEMLEELVTLFKQNALEFIGQVKLGIKSADFTIIQFAAHKVKAGLWMMETYSLCKIAEKIHNSSEAANSINEIEKLYNTFLIEYPIVEKAIGNEVERLKRK